MAVVMRPSTERSLIGVDAHQRTFELFGFGQLIKKIGNGRDLVGLLGDRALRQRQPRVGRVGAERVQGFEPLALVVSAARCLAVDGNEIMPVWPQGGDPTLKTASEQQRI